jgi:hypothetical protein
MATSACIPGSRREFVNSLDELLQESKMHRRADGQEVRRGAHAVPEQAQRGQVRARTLEQVERLPSTPGLVVIADPGLRREPRAPTPRIGDLARANRAEVSPVLGGITVMREFPVRERGDFGPVVQKIAGTGVAVDDADRTGRAEITVQPGGRLFQ